MIAFGTLLLAQDVWNTELRYKCSSLQWPADLVTAVNASAVSTP